jgi:hypothetical protein
MLGAALACACFCLVRVYTFETIAREWHASNKRWSEDHRSRVLRYLELYIFPHIGSSDIR